MKLKYLVSNFLAAVVALGGAHPTNPAIALMLPPELLPNSAYVVVPGHLPHTREERPGPAMTVDSISIMVSGWPSVGRR